MSGESDRGSSSHLRIQAITVPVTDLVRSLEFFETVLGFRIIQQVRLPTGKCLGFVAPPDGAAILVLGEADSNGLDRGRVGTPTGVVFVTDSIEARYREWSDRGVRFTDSPKAIPWGGRYTSFLDPDGNAYGLAEADAVTQQLETERRAIAEREAREQRAAVEIAIATQVQAGLLPSYRPQLATLDYAGICLQARRVGGDYFDFLDFGAGRVGLVVGDVSGKGLGAALLMANLQAHVRSQYSLHRDDLTAMLTSVNHLFLKSAPAASYATLFFGVYDDRSRQLRFVNCGHPPALLLRRDGAVEQMATTSPVLGMFETWTGLTSSVDLDAGDVMVLYTDGVTEALDAAGDEFGVTRLAEALCVERFDSAERLLDRAVSAVRSFSGAQQDDDITIVVARCT
jgi:serine phosphatase RsbU (regulator of sigma subunit)/predicted enzyme related to lactoylglutathione lyase